jgi:hypothetical protein
MLAVAAVLVDAGMPLCEARCSRLASVGLCGCCLASGLCSSGVCDLSAPPVLTHVRGHDGILM